MIPASSETQHRTRGFLNIQLTFLIGLLLALLTACTLPTLSSNTSRSDVRLARYVGLRCDTQLPKVPNNMIISRLHDCNAINALYTLHPDPDKSLTASMKELEEWVILTLVCDTAATSCAFDTFQLAKLEKQGYQNIEEEFRTTASGINTHEDPERRSKASSDRSIQGIPSPGLDNWHSTQTGAARVVPELLEDLKNMTASTTSAVYTPRIRVAVLDSGIDATALASRIDVPLISGITHTSATAIDPAGWNATGVCPTGILSCALQDEMGHGTAVTDVLLAASGGMALPISIRVLDSIGSGWASGLSTGLIVSLGLHKAQLVNLSLGVQVDTLPRYLSTPLSVLRGFGVRVYAAAGNRTELLVDDGPLYQPAAGGSAAVTGTYPPRVVAISGLTPAGTVSEQAVAQLGNQAPTLFAPSEHICARTADGVRLTPFIAPSGTSFAVPQVVGAMALLMARTGMVSPVGPTLVSQFSVGSDLEARLTGTAARLDVCQAAAQLGLGVESCVSWQDGMQAAAKECPLPTPVATDVVLEDATPEPVTAANAPGVGMMLSEEGTVEASDQGVDAVWNVLVSAMPGQGVCDWCTSYNGCRTTETGMTLTLGNVPCDFTAFQLRVSNAGGSLTYLDVNGALEDAAASQCGTGGSGLRLVDVSAEISFPAGTMDASSSLFLVARDGANLWSGRPVMRTCQ